MPRLIPGSVPPVEIRFERIGVKQATTFTGLCSHHDNSIFRPIDVGEPDLSNQSHLFLLAYRAVLREHHAVLQNAIRFQSTYQKRVEVGLSPGTEPCEIGLLATSHLCNAFETYEHKRGFDIAFLADEWQRVQHRVLVLNDQTPSIAVSSMFSLDDIDAPETPRVCLSLFPLGKDVAVVFSAIPDDAPYLDTFLSRILSASSYYQKYLLSKLILQCCDNFVIDPMYYDSLSQVQKDVVSDFFVSTITKNADDIEDERLYLF